jgi:cell division protein FtsL
LRHDKHDDDDDALPELTMQLMVNNKTSKFFIDIISIPHFCMTQYIISVHKTPYAAQKKIQALERRV